MSHEADGSSLVPTDALLEWASELTFEDLPADAIELLRDDMVDGFGSGLFGSTLPATRLITETIGHSGPMVGPCRLWGTADRASALDAVVVNAAGVNGFELDDYCGQVRGVHGAMTVYPVLVAVSELTHAVTGHDFFAAAAAGWEVSTRVSMAMGPTVLDRGFYMTPMYATLGSAVAAGRALHLDADRMKACFSLALLHASGLAVTTDEGIGKPLSSGEAVRSGLLCALLAMRGASGPRHAYDHPHRGFAAVFGKPEERNDDALIVRPGQPLASQNIRFKAYASCGAGQVVTDIMGDIMRANPTVGPDTVQNVELRINATGAGHIGGVYEPRDATNAQFNLRYCVAAQLLEGDNSAEQFREELLTDQRILGLTSRVNVIPDPTVGVRATHLRNEAFVTVQLKDGTTERGHAETNRVMDRVRIRDKFTGLAAHAISPGTATNLLGLVDGLEHAPDAAALAELLVRADGI